MLFSNNAMYFSSLHIFFFAKFIVLLYIYQCVPTTLHEIFLNQLFPKVLARDAAHAFTSSYHTSSPVWDQHFDCLSQSSSSKKMTTILVSFWDKQWNPLLLSKKRKKNLPSVSLPTGSVYCVAGSMVTGIFPLTEWSAFLWAFQFARSCLFFSVKVIYFPFSFWSRSVNSKSTEITAGVIAFSG